MSVHEADVRDGAALKGAARAFMSAHGVPDVVIGNAGNSVGALTELEEDLPVLREDLETNGLWLVNTFQPDD